MAHTDWLPHCEQDFVDLSQKWTVIIGKNENVSDYNWDTAECTDLLGKIKVFLIARAAYEANDSSRNRVIKDEAKKAAMADMRTFANASIRYNKKIPDTIRQELGIKPKDTTPTQRPIPASQPETIVENTKNHYEHKLIAINPDGKTAGKPADAYGIKYAWQVGGEKPVSGEDLPKSHFSRKTDYTVTYTEAVKGTLAYYAARYENSKGDGGPWSPVVEAFIG